VTDTTGFDAPPLLEPVSMGSTGEATQVRPTGVPGVTLTVREAAKACAVHANTVRRRLKGGEFPNAFRDSAGAWRIPVVDLEAAGLRPNRFGDTTERVVVVPEASEEELHLLREAYDVVKILEEEADALRAELATLQQRAAFAETLASERADRIDDLRIALRALEAVNPRPEDRFVATAAPVAPPRAPEAVVISPPVVVAPLVEPTVEPVVEPTLEPEVAPDPTPDAGPDAAAVGGSDAVSESPDEPAISPAFAAAPAPARRSRWFRRP
jgi:hypothetical protein